MRVTTVQWNIGGGKIRNETDDPGDSASYSYDGLSHITEILKRFSPDIISLQETHANDKNLQTELIAGALGMKYFVNDTYDKSHLDERYDLGQGIISRFPIADHQFKFFLNPRLKMAQPDGSEWVSHDKGVSRCHIEAGENQRIEFLTLHAVPFRKFNADLRFDDMGEVRRDMEEKIIPRNGTCIIQGDFNIDDKSLRDYFPKLFEEGMEEIEQEDPTTPKGRRYDHVLYRDFRCISTLVETGVLTDHFPIVSVLEYR